VLRKLGEKAKIPDNAQEDFSSQIAEAIENAHEEHDVKDLRLFSTDEIATLLKGVARDAGKLCELLSRMKAHEAKFSLHIVAGKYLYAFLSEQRLNINTYRTLLNDLAKAAEAAAKDARGESGRPRGTPHHAAFDLFVRRLLLAAKYSGGTLTVYKSIHVENGWAGTLLDVVKLLRPQLPKGFLPMTKLGNSLDRIAKEFRRSHPGPEKTRETRSK
jgi:hypothetical protein